MPDMVKCLQNWQKITPYCKEAIHGTQAVAMAVFMAQNGETKNSIREYLMKKFHKEVPKNIKSFCSSKIDITLKKFLMSFSKYIVKIILNLISIDISF